MKNALLYPYVFGAWEEDWSRRLKWVCDVLREEGYEIYKTKDFNFLTSISCPVDLSYLKEWNGEEHEIVIYNHADLSEIKTKNLPTAKHTWFFKPTVPDEFTTTLDELGYGSYSSITYKKPPYEEVDPDEVSKFYEETVTGWIRDNDSKWGQNHFKKEEIPYDDFYLVVGQCGGDSVVNRQDFGGYFEKLELIVLELLSVDPNRKIIVKLHPYTNGPMENPTASAGLREHLTQKMEGFSTRVKVYSDFSSIHSFVPKARCIFIGNSGAAFEVMMHDKPIVSFCQPEYHWVTYDLRKTCDIYNAIKLDWFNADSQRKFLYWYMEKYCFYDYMSTKRRIDDLLEEEIEYKVNFL
jgi:hypothetical protein